MCIARRKQAMSIVWEACVIGASPPAQATESRPACLYFDCRLKQCDEFRGGHAG